ncbi:DUF500-domain-containing protein [Coprinopsis marcescibilis]|uniref:DUF500-domain-containing protein n=1 Tax=Coprinopsis marcescibilis TaxID=230819 RepID=A0A5C3LCE1_COPMA|nr:DUF500-domain-containing protein [Coprinopsis marcescibilis]
MHKFNSPLPQSLQKECAKAAKIFSSFVDDRHNVLDRVVPRSVLANAKGFAIFTIFKAGFLVSVRGGSGVVIAKLDDGTWSAPSAIGAAGAGGGIQAGAEVTDFLVVLNSRSAVRTFMAAGSLTLGGNMSVALGPLGRNGEATGAVGTNGKVAAMYSYSKTRGLFGGISLEGSVIVERQDANAIAYQSPVTVRMLLGGMVPPPSWAMPLVQTLDSCTSVPTVPDWIDDRVDSLSRSSTMTSTGSRGSSRPSFFNRRNKSEEPEFPPASWSTPMDGSPCNTNDSATRDPTRNQSTSRRSSGYDEFETTFSPPVPLIENLTLDELPASNIIQPHAPPSEFSAAKGKAKAKDVDLLGLNDEPEAVNHFKPLSSHQRIKPKPELAAPLSEGVARAIALYKFDSIEPGDLSFNQGEVITVTQKSESTDAWWTGKLHGRKGIFPANFVELV